MSWERKAPVSDLSIRMTCGAKPFLILCDHPDPSLAADHAGFTPPQTLDLAGFSVCLAENLEGTAIIRGQTSRWKKEYQPETKPFDLHVAEFVQSRTDNPFVILVSSASSGDKIKVIPVDHSLFAEIAFRELGAFEREGLPLSELGDNHPLVKHAKHLGHPYVQLRVPDRFLNHSNVSLLGDAFLNVAKDYAQSGFISKQIKKARYWALFRLRYLFTLSNSLLALLVAVGAGLTALVLIVNKLDAPKPVYQAMFTGTYESPANREDDSRADLLLDDEVTISLAVHKPDQSNLLSTEGFRCSLSIIPDTALIRQFATRSRNDPCRFHVRNEPIFFAQASSPRSFRFAINAVPPHKRKPVPTNLLTAVLHDFGAPVIYMPSEVGLSSHVPARLVFTGRRPKALVCRWTPGMLFPDTTSCDTTFQSPSNLVFYPDKQAAVSVYATVEDSQDPDAVLLVRPHPVVVRFLNHLSPVERARVKQAPPAASPQPLSQITPPRRLPPTIMAGMTSAGSQHAGHVHWKPATPKPGTQAAPTADHSTARPASRMLRVQPVGDIIRGLDDSEDVTRYDLLSTAIKTLRPGSRINVSEALDLLGSIQEPARNDALLNWLLPHIAMPLTGADAARLLGGADGYDRATLLQSLSPCIKRPIGLEVRDQLLETIQGFARRSAEDVLDKHASCPAGDGKGS